MNAALGFLSLVLALGVSTWAFGWLAVPVVAIAFGALASRPRAPLESMAASALAWLALLGIQAARGPVDQVARTLGGIVGVPAWVIPALTLLLGAALAWSGTVLGREIGRAARVTVLPIVRSSRIFSPTAGSGRHDRMS